MNHCVHLIINFLFQRPAFVIDFSIKLTSNVISKLCKKEVNTKISYNFGIALLKSVMNTLNC